MSNSSDIFIGYTPNDFFYVDAINKGLDYAPNDKDCKNLSSTPLDCGNVDIFRYNGNICLKQELCKNQSLVNSLSLEYNNNGSIQKYKDDKYNYYNYLMNIVNLGIGISAMIYLIIIRRQANIS
jgi:hypothetical protein